MRREPPLTLHRALRILGQPDPPWLNRLDQALDGAISVADPPRLGAAMFDLLWTGNRSAVEVVALLHAGLDRVPNRLVGAEAYGRAELVAAAHTTLAYAAFIAVADRELPASRPRPHRPAGVERLLNEDVPAPAASGFWENLPRVERWYGRMPRDLLAITDDNAALAREIARAALHTYQARYLRLATAVPEFLIWASLGQDATTGTVEVPDEVGAAMATNTHAMARLEALLRLCSGPLAGPPDLRHVLHRCNAAVLDQTVMHPRSAAGPEGLRFPFIRDVYLNPRYRICLAGRAARPADEDWWKTQPVQAGLDLCLTAHVLTAAATKGPLLLLGHPGAGKSLLTKVLAARLPPDRYTVVRVPLRAVPANGRVLGQIDAALAAATNESVRWRPLVEQSRDTIRVVLLDGLDELLQATPDDRTAYLDDVAEFQRNEANQDRPAVVIVTSRTVVADRIDIPAGTTVVKLDDFDNSQVGAWLDVWNATNAEAVAADALRPLPPAAALLHPELARQPLLLLMLALYAADPAVPVLEAGVSATELYRRLFDAFAGREIGNRPQPPPPQQRDAAVRERLDRLSAAAFAMFNRGRQEVTGAELAADLVALRMADADVLGDSSPGHRLLGEFFFVHVAEARTRDEARRAYEFLHATFGEYLIARRVVDVLAETAERAFTGRFAPHEPDDALLFALLSHESLAVRRPTLAFVRDLFATLPEPDRSHIPQLLSVLLADYRSRQRTDRFCTYRPRPIDHARELAAYCANLVLLRTAIAGGVGVPLQDLFSDSRAALAPLEAWRSTVALWKAALDEDSWESTVTVLALSDTGVHSTLAHANAWPLEIVHARLIGDTQLEHVVRYGLAAAVGKTYAISGSSWADTVRTAALAFMVGPHMNLDLPASADGATVDEIERAVQIVWRAARSRRNDLTSDGWRALIDWTLRVGSVRHLDGPLVADLVVQFPRLLDSFPKVNPARLPSQRPAPDPITVTTYRWNS